MTSSPPPQAPPKSTDYPQPGAYYDPAAQQSYRSTSAAAVIGMPTAIVQDQPGPARLLAGIALGAIFGVIGAYILKTIVYYAHFNFSYFNILVGGAVGYGVVIGSGRRGMMPAIISALLSFASMMFADYLLLASFVDDKYGALANAGPIPFSIFVEVQKHQDAIHWICVAFGVYAAYSLCMQRHPSRAS